LTSSPLTQSRNLIVVDAQATSLIFNFCGWRMQIRRVGVPFGVFFTRYHLGKAIKIGF
jgi:hypothetical protein